MIIEHALLRVRRGQEAGFEAVMAQAKLLISASPSFVSIEVRPALEIAGTYLLLVRWQSVADHRDGFRKSSGYQTWRDLLHGFYETMPDVSYFGDPL